MITYFPSSLSHHSCFPASLQKGILIINSVLPRDQNIAIKNALMQTITSEATVPS